MRNRVIGLVAVVLLPLLMLGCGGVAPPHAPTASWRPTERELFNGYRLRRMWFFLRYDALSHQFDVDLLGASDHVDSFLSDVYGMSAGNVATLSEESESYAAYFKGDALEYRRLWRDCRALDVPSTAEGSQRQLLLALRYRERAARVIAEYYLTWDKPYLHRFWVLDRAASRHESSSFYLLEIAGQKLGELF